MSGRKLDQLVKGQAAPNASASTLTSPSPSSVGDSMFSPRPPPIVSDPKSPFVTQDISVRDPLSILPSSPPQIYLNLLILEASLRSQYLLLRARRRQNTFFLLLLGLWNSFFFYALFLQPREDGSGIGGSVYWVVDMTEKVALMGGVVTGVLVWGTGQWERGVRWPRRFVAVANRGLRTMNCKIIVLRGSWWKELLGHLAVLLPSSIFSSAPRSYFHLETQDRHKHSPGYQSPEDGEVIHEDELAPGGDHVKLLLLPKSFSSDFREKWESYRSEYWEKENKRRASLLHKLKQNELHKAHEQAGWFQWARLSGRKRSTNATNGDIEHNGPRHHPELEHKRLATRKTEAHSRNASRSSTPGSLDGEEQRPSSRGSRRGSSGAPSDGRRRPKGLSSGAGARPALGALSEGASGRSPKGSSGSI